METKEVNNIVEVSVKKSSSKDGNYGFDVSVRADGSKTQKEMEDIADIATKVAMKTAEAVRKIYG